MIYKDDWELCQKRFDAFWAGDMLDRCSISATSLRKNPLPTSLQRLPVRTKEERWLDAPRTHHNNEIGCHEVYLGGDAFPNYFVNLGPGVVAAFMGSPYLVAEDTIWFDREPMIPDWEHMPEIRLDRNSPMWKTAWSMTEYYAQRAEGKYIVSLTDLGGSLDIVASLRGSQPLLMDLYDEPERVLDLIAKVDRIWLESYDAFQKLIATGQEGTTTWIPLWCRDRYYTLQCDFSAMISPGQFERFVLPSLVGQTDFLDRSIYHLDGPGQLAHLDMLLDIDRLTGIQWVPGAGIPDEMDESWFPLYRKIQARGKNLVLSCQDNSKLERLLDNISPVGLYIGTSCPTEDEAAELVKNVEKWSAAAVRRTAGLPRLAR
jgi:5-methyltetrahydrofolate--homocysteine methyltransferase